jgi:hypothetical protein
MPERSQLLSPSGGVLAACASSCVIFVFIHIFSSFFRLSSTRKGCSMVRRRRGRGSQRRREAFLYAPKGPAADSPVRRTPPRTASDAALPSSPFVRRTLLLYSFTSVGQPVGAGLALRVDAKRLSEQLPQGAWVEQRMCSITLCAHSGGTTLCGFFKPAAGAGGSPAPSPWC